MAPEARQLHPRKLDESDRVISNVLDGGVAIGGVAGDQIWNLLKIAKVLVDVADAAALVVRVVAAVQGQVGAQMQPHECSIGVIVVDPWIHHGDICTI